MSESSATITPSTPLIARASKWFSFKNLMIVLMCLGAAGWFAYDGWIRWPGNNDRLVTSTMTTMLNDGRLAEEHRPQIEAWNKGGGWNTESKQSQEKMTNLALEAAKTGPVEGWKSPTDILTQRIIVLALLIASLVALWRLIHFARQRAIATPDSVSPSPGIVIPWEKISRVDNTRWKKVGIITITYDLGQGPQKAKFDDYELEREPLLLVLDLLSEKAVNAEFIPKEDWETPAPPPSSNPS